MLAAIFVRGAFGAFIGALMTIGGLGCAGYGHGTYLPAAVIAAPLSLGPAGLFMAPVLWGILAGLTALRWRVPLLVCLGVHLAAAGACLFFGTPMEPGDDIWRDFWRAFPSLAVWIRGTLTLYAIAMVALFVVAAIPATVHTPDADDYLRRR